MKVVVKDAAGRTSNVLSEYFDGGCLRWEIFALNYGAVLLCTLVADRALNVP